MGRSPSFCFSIKACAGKAGDGEFSRLQEVKTSPEKRRWSFRKKFAGQHVPSNTGISEPLPIFSEDQNQEATSDTFYSEKALSETDKSSLVEQTSPTFTVLVDQKIPEHVIVIQTSIRRCLAQNELQKHKNAVKIQAAARGYLVRRQAAGTLRCIQSIVKIQALVRARNSVQSSELTEKNNLDEYLQADVVKQSNMELKRIPSVVKKLDSSAFARQLLESTPKAKSIRISCDPLRLDSAWDWLERWMALTSVDQQRLVLNQEDLDEDIKNDLAAYDVNVRSHDIPQQASSDLDLTGNSPEMPEVKKDLITISSTSTELSAPACVSDQFLNCHVQDNEQQSSVQETFAMEKDEDWSKRKVKVVSNNISIQMQQPLDAILHLELDDNLSKPDYTKENLKNSDRNELIGSDEIEESKALNGSRKSKNPAFAAVQAKFEELSSASDSNIYFDRASSIVVSVSKSVHSQMDFTSKKVNERKSVYSKVDDEVTLNGASSDVSKEFTDKEEDNIPARKKPQLALKNSPTHLKNGSDARSSGEQLRKGVKNIKRPNSSGSDKTNHADNEDKNSSNSLPNYMQLTESAKAKINTNFLQKPSIGVHHNDNLIKKRHSLPIGNEKQGLSPRMRSPKSQTPKI